MLTSFFALFSVFFLANAAPVNGPTELVAYGPKITQPTGGAYWPLGSTQEIDWDTADVPSDAQNHTLEFVLGHWENNSENLNLTYPLATNVPIMAGHVTVQIRLDTPPRSDYFVAAIGVADDLSATFTIDA